MKTTDVRSLFSRERPGIALALVLLVAIPLLNATGVLSDLSLNLLGRYLCFGLAGLGIGLIWGQAGILSLCQAFFFCLGGYCIGMHMLLITGEQGVYGSALPDFMVWTGVTELPWFWRSFDSFAAAVFFAMAVPAAAAFVFGYLAFRRRIKGVYFSIISQALALAMWLVFLRNETRLGGTNGLTDFKTLLGLELRAPSTRLLLYLVTAAVVVGAYFSARWLTTSKFGKTLVAIRDSETRVRFTGIPVARYKVVVFCIAALLAGIGGMLYVPQTGIITPGRMDVRASLEMVVWVAVGGRATLMGPILGAVGISLLYSWLTGVMPGAWLYVLGALFIGVVLFLPGGVAGLWAEIRPRLARLRNRGNAAPGGAA